MATAIAEWGLSYVVLTSVDRDDLVSTEICAHARMQHSSVQQSALAGAYPYQIMRV